jgi:hypothetical protein
MRGMTHRRHWRVRVLLGLAAAVALAATACAAGGSLTAVAQHEVILLVPPVQAGGAGWCLVTLSDAEQHGGCAGVRARYPIIAQTLHTNSSPAEAGGDLLTEPQVAAVSVGGSAPLATQAESVLPSGLRVLKWRIADERPTSPGFPPTITPLAADGTAIPQSARRGRPLIVFLPTENLSGALTPRHGACAIEATRLPALSVKGSSVIRKVTAYQGLIGDAFMECASTEYVVRQSPILASVLIDAAHPGAEPSALPAMRPLAGHAGIFEAPGQEGPQVARRIRGGWLIVSKGAGDSQRLLLLDNLRATGPMA